MVDLNRLIGWVYLRIIWGISFSMRFKSSDSVQFDVSFHGFLRLSLIASLSLLFLRWYRSIVDVSIFGVNLQKENSEIQFDTRNHRWIDCKRSPKKAESWTWPFSCQSEVKKTSYRRSNSLISRFQFHCWVGRIYAHGPITGFQLPLPIFSLFARFMFKTVFSFEMNIYVGID